MKTFLLLSLLFTFQALGAWVHEPRSTSIYLDLNPLRFSNRADCALESKRPARSFFLLADSLNLGKVLYRLGDRLDKKDEFTLEGIRRYRYTTFSLAKIVANRLLKGELPLLNSRLPGWDEVLKECREESCPTMNETLGRLWNHAGESGERLAQQPGAYTSCYSLKKFSALEEHLSITKPSLDALNNIGAAVHNRDDFLSVCEDSVLEDDLKVGVYQIDLRQVSEEEWNRQGFAFWNSFKIYYSWAFRYSQEAKLLGAHYSSVIRQIDLEESVLLFPNGCASMIAPECGKDFLNLTSLRTLAQAQGAQELSQLDYFDKTPSSPTGPVMNPVNPQVNNDVLDLQDYQKASEWAANFRENLVKTRGFYKLKFSKAVSILNLIQTNLKDTLLPKLQEYSEKMLSSEAKETDLQELYLLCSEYRLALDEKMSFLHDDLKKMMSERSLREASRIFSEEHGHQLDWMLNQIGPGILNFCQGLERKGVWAQSSRASNKLFAPWYQEYVHNVKINDFNLKLADNIQGRPTLYVQSLSDKTICETPAHCARRLLETLVDLKSVSTYASGLFNLGEGLKSPSLLNPMAERYACRSYDPWFKTRKTILDLFQDLLLTTTSAVLPTPVYFDVSVREKKILSFNEIVKDGKVFYDPRFDKKRIQASLIADFGPLLSAPCALAINNDNAAAINLLVFEGITFQSCVENQRNTMTVYGPQDIQNNQARRAACFSCTINLSSAASSATTFTPGLRPLVFLLRGAVRLVKNLRDPNDIPRSWEVKTNSVYRSWRRLGSVYSSCLKSLSKGRECLGNSCEGKLVSAFEETHKRYVKDIIIYPGGVSEIAVKGEKKKWGVKIPRLGCSMKEYKKEDFFTLEASE
jgi:hypothetical protein